MRAWLLRLIALATSALLVATGAPAQNYDRDYTIESGDTLDITVLEDPSLNRQALVRPDGKISMPLIGAVQAGGRTPEQVQATIRARLSRDFVSPPTVTVSLLGLGPDSAAAYADTGTIYMIGQVANPGPYELELPINLLQALAVAGGPGTFAARHRIQVRRRVAGEERVFLMDYDAIEDGHVPSPIISLADGDVVVVPERGLFD